MSCGFDESLLHAYVDEELSSDDKTKVLGHIVWCENCRKEVENIKKLSKGIKETFSKQAPIAALEGIQRGIEGVGTRRGIWTFKYHIVAAAAALVIVSVVSLEIFRASEQNALPEIARIKAPALRGAREEAEKPKATVEEASKEAKTNELEMTVDSFLAYPSTEEAAPALNAPEVETAEKTAPAAEPSAAQSVAPVRKTDTGAEELVKAMIPPAPPAAAAKPQASAVAVQAPAPASTTKEVQVNLPPAPAKTELKDETLVSGAGGGEKKTGTLAAPTKEEKRVTADAGRAAQPTREGAKTATRGTKPAEKTVVKPPLATMAQEAEAALKGKTAGALAEGSPAKTTPLPVTPPVTQPVTAQAPSEPKNLAAAMDKQAGAGMQEAAAANAVGADKAKAELGKEKAGAAKPSYSMEGLVTEWSPIIRLSASGQRSARLMTLRQAQVLGAIIVSVGEPVRREGMDIASRRTLSWNEQMVKIFVLQAKPAQDAPVKIMQRTEGWVTAEEGVIPISEEMPYMVVPDKPITEPGRYATITVVTQDRR